MHVLTWDLIMQMGRVIKYIYMKTYLHLPFRLIWVYMHVILFSLHYCTLSRTVRTLETILMQTVFVDLVYDLAYIYIGRDPPVCP